MCFHPLTIGALIRTPVYNALLDVCDGKFPSPDNRGADPDRYLLDPLRCLGLRGAFRRPIRFSLEFCEHDFVNAAMLYLTPFVQAQIENVSNASEYQWL